MTAPASSSFAPINTKAAAWTIGVHTLLLLLFFFLAIGIPKQQPVVEMGMEVNIGSSANGSGRDQPLSPDDPSPAPIDLAESAVQPSQVPDIMRGNDPHDVTVPAEAARRNTRPDATTRPASTATQRGRYYYEGATGTGGNRAGTEARGSSEGNTTGPGDRGVPGGTPGSPNYTGSPGTGNGGISHGISGRSLVARPSPEAEYREGGKVVFFITVNRDGAIINSRVKRSASAELTAIAQRKLRDVRFNKSQDGPPEQSGDFVFQFSGRRAQ